MAALMQAFDRICSSDGDQTAFHNSLIDSNHSSCQPLFQTVGFSELNENIKLITSELHNRHGLRRNGSNLTCRPLGLPSERFITEACDPNVLIVSNQPSPGEAAAIMACTQLHIPFVPMALDGPHRTSDSRAKIIVDEMKPAVAIVVLCLSEEKNQDDDDEDWESKPALSNQEVDVDSHVTISKLHCLGMHRIITVKGQDGSVIGSMAGLNTERNLPSTPIEEDGRDPMYILYTSGSTSRPKAVVQTYAGLWNRIQWQWKFFPFVQQMRRENGLKETVKLLIEDGIVDEHGANANNINDVVLRRTSLSFVDSIVEIFGPLLAGVALYCPLWLDHISGGQETMKYCGLSESLDLASRDGVRVTRLTCIPSQLTQALCGQKNRQNPSDWTSSLDFIIVSGEACQPSLPKLFDEIMLKEQPVLLNLYGQTESSGDVSCMIISASDFEEKDQALTRFPNSRIYVREVGEIPVKHEKKNFVEKCQKSLIPCGLPITGHKFMLRPIADKVLASSGVGQLFVSGPGLALGYFNNKNEMTNNFMIHDNEIWLNTMDLAFEDAKSGTITIVGRAPKGVDDAKNGCSISIGKINGVLIHSAEMESIFNISMKKVLLSRGITGGVQGNVAVLFNVINRNGKNETKTAVFCNLSRLPVDCCQAPNTSIASSTSTRFTGSDATLQDIFMDTRSTIHNTSHPAMVPHLILPLNYFPKNGAAGKVDLSSLVDIASNYFIGQKMSINRNDIENAEESVELSLTDVISVYSEILHVKFTEIKGLTTRSFAEFGGDSLMAITAAHKIISSAKMKNVTLMEENTITAIDLMTLSIQEVYSIIISGRQPNQPSIKRQRVMNEGIDDVLETLPSTTLYESDSSQQYHGYLKKAWKASLQMCVDSSPILIESEGRSLLMAASQGGDLAIIDTKSGIVEYRCRIEGKIEGDLNYLVSKRNGTEEIVVFVSAYENKKKMGRLEVFKLRFDPTLTLEKFWSYESDGEIKSKPCVFFLPPRIVEVKAISDYNGQCHERVLSSSYGGSLSYLDIHTGALLEKKENLGGAIHADPVVIEDSSSESLYAIVASCSWKGKVSCLKIDVNCLIHLWDIDLWTPIYSPPQHIDIESTDGIFPSLVICGIDGSVRCLDYKSKGDERWKVENSGCRPIFTPCLALKTFIIFGSYDGKIRCLNVKDGSPLWDSEDLKSPIVARPVHLKNDCDASPDAVVVATTSGNIHVLNASTGTPLCRPEDGKMVDQLRLDGEIFCNPICAQPFIYYGCRDSHMYSIRFETA